jgi:hypothetical protein
MQKNRSHIVKGEKNVADVYKNIAGKSMCTK